MHAHLSTTAVETWAGTGTACPVSTRSLHQHQMGTDTERGQSLALGACRLALVADYQPQDWSALCRAGFFPGLTNRRREAFASRADRNSEIDAYLPGRRWPVFGSSYIGLNSPERAFVRCAGAFIRSNAKACRPRVRQSLAHEQVVQAVAHVPHFHNHVLSSSLIAWSQPSEAAHGRVPKPSRAFHRNEGEFPNVCG